MKCKHCGERMTLTHKEIRIDITHKEYWCPNKHKMIIKKYGNTNEYESEGKKYKRTITR